MGEPLHNIENVIKAADILVDEQGLYFSPRRVTVSTSGLVPQLKRFLKESKCALAVSLNATTDEVLSLAFFYYFYLQFYYIKNILLVILTRLLKLCRSEIG